MSDMQAYAKNKNCSCARCRASGLMGAAILITIGALALVGQFSGFRGRLWPVLLIVIGLVMLLQRTASTEGHIQPWGTAPQPSPDAQDPWASGRGPGTTTRQLPPAAGTSGSASQQENDQQVKP